VSQFQIGLQPSYPGASRELEKKRKKVLVAGVMSQTISEQLTAHGQCLSELLLSLPEGDAITDTLDYILGALHGLSSAHRTGFVDRPSAFVPFYRAYLVNDALNVSSNKSLNPLWLAGYDFNSALQRVAAAFDRIPRMLGANLNKRNGKKAVATSAKERMAAVNAKPYENWLKVYDEVNAFKHSPDGRATGRTVSMDEAVSAFGEMTRLLIDNKTKLITRYAPGKPA
jgi:hypothetical protein